MTHPSHPPSADVPAAEGFDLDLGAIRVVFGAGTLDRLGELADALGSRRPLVVTDPGLVAAGHAEHAERSLAAAGLTPARFDGVRENPSELEVAAARDAAQAHAADLLIGLGGGSAMDCAKGANFLLSGGGRMEDYWGVDRATQPMLPSIGVPTTAGTGSEAQRFALVTRVSDHRKMACGDSKARFRSVILDPSLLASVPHAVSAAAGVDAMAHAVESYVTKRRNDVSQLYAREAWRRVERSLEGHLADPAKLGAAGDLLLGAHFGGAAIEASMLGAAHSLANPLTARFGVVHGAAVGAMLPHVVRFNGDDAEIRSLYAELAKAAELDPAAESGAADRGNDHVSALAARIEALLETARLPRRLAEHGVEDGHLADLAEGAAEQWTARFNPRQLVTGDFERLYRAAL